MEQMRDTIKTTPHENVKNKLLELIQTWAFAFRAIPKYCAVQVITIVLLVNCIVYLNNKLIKKLINLLKCQ